MNKATTGLFTYILRKLILEPNPKVFSFKFQELLFYKKKYFGLVQPEVGVKISNQIQKANSRGLTTGMEDFGPYPRSLLQMAIEIERKITTPVTTS